MIKFQRERKKGANANQKSQCALYNKRRWPKPQNIKPKKFYKNMKIQAEFRIVRDDKIRV